MTSLRLAWLLLGTLLGAVGVVRADEAALAQLQAVVRPATAQLAAATAVTGRFVLDKTVAGFPAPLRSSGEFAFVRDEGLWWLTLQPFESRLALDDRGLRQRDGSGPLQLPNASSQAASSALYSVFMGLFQLDVAALSAQFDCRAETLDHGWRLQLQPRSAALGRVLGELRVEGDQAVRRIELSGSEGDLTVIQLQDWQLQPTPLTPEQRSRFEP